MGSMPDQKPGRSKQDYGTPKELLLAVKNRLKIQEFTIDLAATKENAVAEVYYSLEEGIDSLLHPWDTPLTPGGWTWLNPPFSNISPWVEKAVNESIQGAQIVMLIPASVGSNWWRRWVQNYAYVVHLNGRLTFVGETTPYPKDCSLLLYTPWGFTGHEVWRWRSDV